MHKDRIERKLIFFVVVFVCLLFALWFWWQRPMEGSDNTTDFQMAKQDSINSVDDGGSAYVHISGEVVDPGVYQVTVDMRMFQLIELAGGTTSNADLENINLAQVVIDGSKYVVPEHNDANEDEEKEFEASSITNLNTADAASLDMLPGVGPATAEKIIHFREQHGPFTCPEDIMNVPGIGAAKFEQMQELITAP